MLQTFSVSKNSWGDIWMMYEPVIGVMLMSNIGTIRILRKWV